MIYIIQLILLVVSYFILKTNFIVQDYDAFTAKLLAAFFFSLSINAIYGFKSLNRIYLIIYTITWSLIAFFFTYILFFKFELRWGYYESKVNTYNLEHFLIISFLTFVFITQFFIINKTKKFNNNFSKYYLIVSITLCLIILIVVKFRWSTDVSKNRLINHLLGKQLLRKSNYGDSFFDYNSMSICKFHNQSIPYAKKYFLKLSDGYGYQFSTLDGNIYTNLGSISKTQVVTIHKVEELFKFDERIYFAIGDTQINNGNKISFEFMFYNLYDLNKFFQPK